jgi:hypothetical protein
MLKNKEYPRVVNDSCFVIDDNDEHSKKQLFPRGVK